MERKSEKSATYHYPVTFQCIATAIAFSPTALAVLHEAIRITHAFNARLLLIHVGEKTPESQQRIDELLTQANCDPTRYKVVWKTNNPVQAILDACVENDVDLLIIGALHKENLVQYYKGSIARKLCRKANCSLLLLTHPEVKSRPCNKIVVNGLNHPKTADTIRTAFYVAEAFKSTHITVVEELDAGKVMPKDHDELSVIQATRKKAHLARSEHERLAQILTEVPEHKHVHVEEKCIFGKKGYTIGHFAESNHVDLLMLNSPDTKLGFLDRVFTHDLEYILSDLPTDLLLVHSTRQK